MAGGVGPTGLVCWAGGLGWAGLGLGSGLNLKSNNPNPKAGEKGIIVIILILAKKTWFGHFQIRPRQNYICGIRNENIGELWGTAQAKIGFSPKTHFFNDFPNLHTLLKPKIKIPGAMRNLEFWFFTKKHIF